MIPKVEHERNLWNGDISQMTQSQRHKLWCLASRHHFTDRLQATLDISTATVHCTVHMIDGSESLLGC